MYLRIFITVFILLSPTCWPHSKTILITGGAGYIGTQTCKVLKEAGFETVIYDNFSRSQSEKHLWAIVEKGDILDRKRLAEVIDCHNPSAIIHFAGFKAVGESIADPAQYYINNVCGSIALLDVMREKGVKKIIFSSTAAIYGTTPCAAFHEKSLCDPINPYGTSKWMIEKVLSDFANAYDFRYVIFRYFNVAGADLQGACGENKEEPNNLIPLILQVAAQKRKEIQIFGSDYPTPDGSAVRDYIHVVDLADAHVKALDYLFLDQPNIILNLGTGKGASVKEVVDMARIITGQAIPVKNAPRRPGDPPNIVANAELAKKVLHWQPRYSDLKTIIETEWNWIQKSKKDKEEEEQLKSSIKGTYDNNND